MTMLDEFLTAPEDPTLFARLASGSPAERKKVMKSVSERIAVEKDRVSDLKNLYQAKQLPDDDPEKLPLLAKWNSYHKEMRSLVLAENAVNWRNASYRSDSRLRRPDFQVSPVRELFETEAPRWFPKTYASLSRAYINYEYFSFEGWEWAATLVQRGIVEEPEIGSDYYETWPSFLAWRAQKSADQLLELLARDPDHLDFRLLGRIRSSAVRRLEPRDDLQFQVENGTPAKFGTLLWQACSPAQKVETLRAAMESILDAKTENFARGGILILQSLGASSEELCQVAPSLMALIGSPHAAVVKFAAAEIIRLSTTAQLDPKDAVPYLSAGLLQPSKPTREVVVKLAGHICNRSPEQMDAIQAVVPAACDLEPGVRKAFEKLCTQVPDRLKPDVASWLDECMMLIPGDTRQNLEKILGRKLAQPASEPEMESVDGQLPPSVLRSPLNHPQSPEDLAQLAAQLLTRAPDPMDLELLLDGLAKFAPEQGDEISRLFTPLAKQARHFRKGDGGSAGQYSLVSMFAGDLILGFCASETPDPWWIESLETDQVKKRERYYQEPGGVFLFVQARMIEMVAAVKNGNRVPLLATPEFDDGTISASTLVRRFAESRGIPGWPHRHDLVQAIARTHGSESVTTDGLDDTEAGRVLRFLLTGERSGAMTTASWWLTAARTRQPVADFSSDPDFQQWDESDLSDWTRPAQYNTAPRSIFHSSYHGHSDLLIGEYRRDVPSDCLYVLAHRNGLSRGGYGNWSADRRWWYAITPLHPDGKILLDITALSHVGGAASKQDEMNRSCVADELSRRAPSPRHPLRLVLIRGLGSTKPLYRSTAADLAQGAIHDGRLPSVATEFAETFNRMLSCAPDGGVDGANVRYIASGLRELAGRDSTCRKFVRDLMLAGLREKPSEIPSALTALLELVFELLSEAPPEVPLDLAVTWGTLPESKSEKMARKIAALKS